MIVAQMLMSTGFAGLVEYVMGPSKGIEAGDFRTINIVNAAQAASEMELVGSLNSRASNIVAHLILTWHKDEIVDRPKQFQAGEMVLRALGLTNHQALLVVHSEPKDGLVPGPDGRHHEMHVVVNRVGLDGKVNRLSLGYKRAEIAAREISEALGFRVVPGRFNGVGIDAPGMGGKIGRVQAETGKPTLANEIRDDPDLFERLRTARRAGWPALLEEFARNGISIELGRRRSRKKKPLRSGLVMVDVTDRTRPIKLSSLDTAGEKWGEPALIKEMRGEIPPGLLSEQNEEAKLYAEVARRRKLHRSGTIGGHSALYQQFEREREAARAKEAEHTKARKAARSAIYARAKADVEWQLKMARLRRILLRGFFDKRSLAGHMLNAILDSRVDVRIAKVRQVRDSELKQFNADTKRKPFPRWADWRRTQGSRIVAQPRRTIPPNWLKPGASTYANRDTGMRPFPTIRNPTLPSWVADRNRRPSPIGLKPTGPSHAYAGMRMPRPEPVRKPTQPVSPLNHKRGPNTPGR